MESRLSHFLLAEDDDAHATLVIRAMKLSRIANTIDRVRDGVEAMEYLNRAAPFADKPRPDVLLLDLKMPRMGGLEVLEKMRAEPALELIPVVILTTSDAELDRIRAYRLHANSYLVKPLDFNEFCRMVEELNLYWGIWNRPPCG